MIHVEYEVHDVRRSVHLTRKHLQQPTETLPIPTLVEQSIESKSHIAQQFKEKEMPEKGESVLTLIKCASSTSHSGAGVATVKTNATDSAFNCDETDDDDEEESLVRL